MALVILESPWVLSLEILPLSLFAEITVFDPLIESIVIFALGDPSVILP